MNFKGRIRILVLVILFVSAVLSSYAAFANEPEELLLVAFLDVGQGDAIYIKSPSGHDMLIDGGREDGKVLSALGEILPATDRVIDVVLATHADADHIGGFPEILARYNVKSVVVSGNESETGIWNEFMNGSKNEPGASLVFARKGTIIDLGGGVSFEVLFPDRNPIEWETNLSSIVGILRYGSTTALLTGDSPDEIEKYLVEKSGELLNVDILKLGHHGSDTSTSDEILKATSPAYAIVSAGKGNSYGHPKVSVIERVLKSGACLLRTDESGAIIFNSDGLSFKTETSCSSTIGPLEKE